MNDTLRNFDLAGRTAVVAGAASDIGAAIALHFVDAGANVVLGDLDEERLTAVADRFAEASARLRAQRTDVTRRADLDSLVGSPRANSATST